LKVANKQLHRISKHFIRPRPPNAFGLNLTCIQETYQMINLMVHLYIVQIDIQMITCIISSNMTYFHIIEVQIENFFYLYTVRFKCQHTRSLICTSKHLSLFNNLILKGKCWLTSCFLSINFNNPTLKHWNVMHIKETCIYVLKVFVVLCVCLEAYLYTRLIYPTFGQSSMKKQLVHKGAKIIKKTRIKKFSFI
jgi:hypothetical protein